MGELAEMAAGAATTVGPVPFADPVEAVGFALSATPEFPTVPSAGSGPMSLLAQAVEAVPGLEVGAGGSLVVDPARFEEHCSAAGPAAADPDAPGSAMFREFLAALGSPVGAAAPPAGVRIPVLGPVTLALGLRTAGVPFDVACPLAVGVVATRACQLLSAARSVIPHGVVMLCLNEPGLVGAMHPTFPLPPSMVRDLLDPVVVRIDAQGGPAGLLIGAHVPGRTDWEAVVASGVSVISVPAAPGLSGSAATLGGFLDRGGRIAWGAVPVDQPLGNGEELLWRRLSGVWCELVGEGLDPLMLRTRSLISPADGLGHFGPPQAALAVGLVQSLASRVRCQAVAARLSLGA
jgi:hypothetical protein